MHQRLRIRSDYTDKAFSRMVIGVKLGEHSYAGNYCRFIEVTSKEKKDHQSLRQTFRSTKKQGISLSKPNKFYQRSNIIFENNNINEMKRVSTDFRYSNQKNKKQIFLDNASTVQSRIFDDEVQTPINKLTSILNDNHNVKLSALELKRRQYFHSMLNNRI